MSLLNLPRVGGCGCAVVGYTRTYTQMPTHTHTRIRFKNDELYQCYVAAWNGEVGVVSVEALAHLLAFGMWLLFQLH